ncbi:hypothetical protein [Streptosporangium sp. NPDC001681]|uniref:hypothetical protein n=1 Tax=Streptosporangium sp. NPDC001681 TaxID=3154395 RepID=UPI0033238A5B
MPWRLTPLTNAVITWTTEHYGKAIGELRAQGRDVSDELLSFIAPSHRSGTRTGWSTRLDEAGLVGENHGLHPVA